MKAVIKSAILLGDRHDIDRVAGYVDDGSAGDSYLRHDVARVHVRRAHGGDAGIWVQEVGSPQRRRGTGVGIEGINTVALGRHHHDVVDPVSRNRHLRHVERLGVNITIQRIGIELAEARGIHVRWRQHSFIDVLAGTGIVVVVGAHGGESGLVNNPSSAGRKRLGCCYEVFTIGACRLGPAPVVHLEDNHKQRHARSHGK